MSSTADLWLLFTSLVSPAADGGVIRFSSVALNKAAHRIGKTPEGQPAILIATKTHGAVPPLQLERLQVLPDLKCSVIDEAGTFEAVFTVLLCRTDSLALQEQFVAVGGLLSSHLNDDCSASDVQRVVLELVELFSALQLAPRNTVAGLWSELYLMVRSTDTTLIVSSWHSDKTQLWDFVAQGQRLEVKSTTLGSQMYSFSLDQLDEAGGEIVVAAVQLRAVASGTSVRDLADAIESKLTSPQLISKLRTLIVVTLGNAYEHAVLSSFDLGFANKSLKYYLAHDIPQVTKPLPTGVSDVHFQSNLQSVPTIEPSGTFSHGLLQSLT